MLPSLLSVPNRELIEFVLADDECEVEARGDSREALELLQSWWPDVLLLDLRLPDRDGETFLATRRLLAAGATAALLLSGSTNLDHHAIRLGVNGVLAKPFDIEELCTAVHRLLLKHAHRAIAYLSDEGLEVRNEAHANRSLVCSDSNQVLTWL